MEPSRKGEENLERMKYAVLLEREFLGTFSKQLITELYEFESTCFITPEGLTKFVTENSTKSLVQRKACNKVFGRVSSSSVPLVGPFQLSFYVCSWILL